MTSKQSATSLVLESLLRDKSIIKLRLIDSKDLLSKNNAYISPAS